LSSFSWHKPANWPLRQFVLTRRPGIALVNAGDIHTGLDPCRPPGAPSTQMRAIRQTNIGTRFRPIRRRVVSTVPRRLTRSTQHLFLLQTQGCHWGNSADRLRARPHPRQLLLGPAFLSTPWHLKLSAATSRFRNFDWHARRTLS
jgi:hypothetical protein